MTDFDTVLTGFAALDDEALSRPWSWRDGRMDVRYALRPPPAVSPFDYRVCEFMNNSLGYGQGRRSATGMAVAGAMSGATPAGGRSVSTVR